MPSEPLGELRRLLRGTVEEDRASLERVGHDGSHLVGRPLAAVRPADAEDVERLVEWARRTRTPLVARGAGTSLDGESTPTDGAVVCDLSGWSRILEVSAEEGWARVEPGVVNFDLQRHLAGDRLFFPPNPGSWTQATIGGNVGTNASGPRSFRYGPTRAWVREVGAVLGTGETVRLGTKAAKRSVGPELLSMFVGSEGTLGIATEVTVRLAAVPAIRRGLVVQLPDGVALGRLAVRLARASGTGLSAVEYLDRGCATALSSGRRSFGAAGGAALLLEVEADDAGSASNRVDRVRSTLRDAGVSGALEEFPEADDLWVLRGESSVVLDERFGHRIREDVAVPLGRVDALLTEIDRIAREEGVPLFLFAHLGEGSLHPNFVVDPSTPAAERVRAALLAATLALDGTISAEHGIGRLKVPYVAAELGPGAIRLLHAVKRACDPEGILNPGKVYPPDPGVRGPARSP